MMSNAIEPNNPAAIADKNTQKPMSDQSMLWGMPLHFWELWGVRLLVGSAIAGSFTVLITFASAYILYEVADVAQKALVAEQKSSGDQLRESNERIATLNNDTARLTADNLSLQTTLLPRSVGLIGVNQRPPAETWFAGFQRWAGIKVLIQVIPGDPEAQNLANEIAVVLSKFGWRPELVDEKRSGVSLHLSEGLTVISPASYKMWDPKNEAQQRFGVLREAAISLASALTAAGLGVGSYPVPGTRGFMMVVDFPVGSDGDLSNPFRNFSPELDGVYLQVGSRPVASTIRWIKQGRPNESGVPTAPVQTPAVHK